VVEKEVENNLVVARAAPTAVPKQTQTGKLVTDKLITVLATPTKQSALDCQVTGSATVNHRPSVEYLLGVDHATGEITNMLAEEWEASDDLHSFKVKLRKGVQFHNGLGEFAAKIWFTLGITTPTTAVRLHPSTISATTRALT